MKTKRLFDERSYRKEFDATVLQAEAAGSMWHIALDQTLFYPESGGQPADKGTLNGFPVIQVIEEGEKIIHVMESSLLVDASVHGLIDWPLRFDHMQQHTGQHLLSQTFLSRLNAQTLSFHLGKEQSTIDFDISDLTEDQIHIIEKAANQIVFENQEVTAHIIPKDKVDTIPFRRPPKNVELLRAIEIKGVDWSACCGTHVSRTGSIGLIKIVDKVRYKGGTRVTFLCGERALTDYQKKADITRRAGRVMTASEGEIPTLIQQWKEEKKEQSKKIRQLLQSKIDFEAQEIWQKADEIHGIKIIIKNLKDRLPEEGTTLVKTLIQNPKTAVVCSIVNDRVFLTIGRSQDVDLDVRPLITKGCEFIDGKGGGSPFLAQANGSAVEKIQEAVDWLKDKVEKILITSK